VCATDLRRRKPAAFYCEQNQMQPTIDTEPIVETLIAAMSKVPEAKSTRALHSELLSNLEIF
jgi:hypothetical protein